jgi:hypothetical protein
MPALRIPVLRLWLAAVLCGRAASFTEDFATDPVGRWRGIGDSNLWSWNAEDQNLFVQWDSARTNSFFLRPLGTVLSKQDDFSVSFDLRLDDVAIGTSSNKPYTFEIAVGFLNSSNSARVNYFRGMGTSREYGVRNVVEFNYFPPTATVQPTFGPTVISSNLQFAFSDNRLAITTGALYRITLSYTASNRVLRTLATRDGAPFGNSPNHTLHEVNLTSLSDFRVDHFGIVNYSDALQFGPTNFWGSVRARGAMDNIVVTVPDSPVTQFAATRSNEVFRAGFVGRSNWLYTLEASSNLVGWATLATNALPSNGVAFLTHTNAAGASFYRVRAERP